MKKSTFLDLARVKHVFTILLLTVTGTVFAQFPAFPPSDVTRTQDRDQMAWQLGITFPELPPKLEDPNAPAGAYPRDANNPEGDWTDSLGTGNTITRTSWGLWNNYSDRWYGFHPGPDSARLGDYPPIDLLKMRDSAYVISTVDDWWNLRRPEILKDVQEQMWGVIPDDTILPAVTWSVVTTTGGSGAAAYIQKVITGTIDISRYPSVRDVPTISATLRVPANAAGPVPVMIVFWSGIDTYWNYAYPQGWGACAFNNEALQPDNGSGLSSYLIGLCNKGNWRTPEQWGTLAAWSWGVSKLIDYFETDPDIDATKIGITGHSRYGKATLVAMAYEPRLFIAFPSDAGSLGTKMNRRHYGQNLENSVWDQEYHWMAGNFMKWGGEKIPGQYMPRKIEDCPVDAHSLLSLCAPRPVFINGGTQSTWTDPYGMYLTTVGATPVYELLGVDGIIMNDPKPVVDKGYIEGTLAYRYHEGGHTDAPDWPAFWQFASKYVKNSTLFYSPTTIILSDTTNSTAKFVITSDTTWSLASSEAWVTPDKTSGTHNDTITIIAEANPDASARRDTIMITAPGLKTMYLFINQKTSAPGVISVSVDTLEVEATVNSHVVNVTSNNVWSVTNLGSWITAQPASSVNNDSTTLSISANTVVTTRMQDVIFAVNDSVRDTLVVKQAPGNPTLTIWTDFFVVGNTKSIAAVDGSTAIIYAITNDPNATFGSSESWLTVTNEPYNSQFQFFTVNLTASGNPLITTRQAQVSINVLGLAPGIVTVTQAAGDTTLSVSDETLDIAADANSTVTFDVFSNSPWIIESSETWLTADPASGSDSMTVTLTAEKNPTSSERMATVTVTADNVDPQPIEVTQAAGEPTSIDKNSLENSISVYLANDMLNIIFDKNISESTVSLVDLSGRQVKHWNISGVGHFTLPVNDIAKGSYVVTISTDKGTITKEVVR